jgi:hypothetical protein
MRRYPQQEKNNGLPMGVHWIALSSSLSSSSQLLEATQSALNASNTAVISLLRDTHTCETYLYDTIPTLLMRSSRPYHRQNRPSLTRSGSPALRSQLLERVSPTEQTTSTTATLPPTPPRLLQQPFPQEIFVLHLLWPNQSRIKLRLLPAES